jgi:hypothetical protein
MELKELVGAHILSGVEVGCEERKLHIWTESCNYVKFTLDGVTYKAVEDPSDGYRSYMEELEVSETPCKIKLPNIEVLCELSEVGEYEGESDVLCVYDVLSGKKIMAVGTENYDDYYPCCVLEYHPENMYCNINRKVTLGD